MGGDIIGLRFYPRGMRKHLRVVALLIPMVLFASNSYAAVKAGSACTKVGAKSISAGKSYTCIKSGKKLVWDKGVLVPVAKPAVVKPTPAPSASASATPKPSSTPKPAPTVANITFENLLENNANVSYTAWKKAADSINLSYAKNVAPEVYTGPNTKAFYNDLQLPISLVSRLFPNYDEPKKILWIRYNFIDIAWAENQAKEKLSAADYAQISIYQGGTLAGSNCDLAASNCRGSYQQTGPSGISLIMEGVANTLPSDLVSKSDLSPGMVEAHEYFHSLQRIPIMNRGIQVWPPAWWREGSADWVQNVAINFKDFESYKSFLKSDCEGNCSKLSEAELAEFLSTAKDNFVPAKFDQFLNYSLGSHVVEILVAIKGPDVLIDMYAEMGKGKTFNDAFYGFFGISWNDAIPILAKSIYKDLHS